MPGLSALSRNLAAGKATSFYTEVGLKRRHMVASAYHPVFSAKKEQLLFYIGLHTKVGIPLDLSGVFCLLAMALHCIGSMI